MLPELCLSFGQCAMNWFVNYACVALGCELIDLTNDQLVLTMATCRKNESNIDCQKGAEATKRGGTIERIESSLLIPMQIIDHLQSQ
jgi:hypothetical protein